MISAIIFDLDGVLVHTDHLHFQAWKALADRLGLPFDQAQGDRCRGVSRMDSLEIVLEGSQIPYSSAEKLALAREKNAAYQALLETFSPQDVPREVVDTLQTLRRRGYRLGLGSSSKNAALILQRTGLAGLLDAVSDGNGDVQAKPAPDIFLRAATLLGVAPEHCAVVEDAHSGVQAAQAAGMMTVSLGAAALAGVGDYPLAGFGALLSLFPGV